MSVSERGVCVRVPDRVAVGDWVRTTTGRTGQSSGVGKKVGDSTGKGEMEGEGGRGRGAPGKLEAVTRDGENG